MSKMSEMDLDRQLIEAVSEAMKDPDLSAEEQIERKLDFIVRDLDEICAMASNAETVDLVQGQRVAVGQILTRAQLIVSFLMSRQPRPRVISNVR